MALVWKDLKYAIYTKSMAFHVINFQRILSLSFSFIFGFFSVIFLPFVLGFQLLSNNIFFGLCSKSFDGIISSWYSTFLIMINTLNVSSENADPLTSVRPLHVIFVFTISILLLNFFIAIMSQSVSVMAKYQNIYLKINKLALILNLESQLVIFTGGLYTKLISRKLIELDERKCVLYIQSQKTGFFKLNSLLIV